MTSSVLLSLSLLATLASAQDGSPFAGGGPRDLPATAAALGDITGLARDAAGNLYVASISHRRIYRIINGNLSIAAPIPATFNGRDFIINPSTLAIDNQNNLYVLQTPGNGVPARLDRISLVTGAATQIPNTVPSSSAIAADASGNVAFFTNAGLQFISPGIGLPALRLAGSFDTLALAFDRNGALFFFTTNNASGRVNRLVAGGTSFVQVQFTSTSFLQAPSGLAFDASGNLFILDRFALHRLRPDNTESRVAGSSPGFVDNVPGAQAQFAAGGQIAVDNAGNVILIDRGNRRLRRVDATPTATTTTIGGNGTEFLGGDGFLATRGTLFRPSGLAFDLQGNLFIADTANNVIRRVDATTGNLSTLATARFGNTPLDRPSAVAVASDGTIFIADTGNNRVLRLPPGAIAATSATTIEGPRAIAIESPTQIFVSDATNRVRRINITTGAVTVVAGNGNSNVSGDGGPATQAAIGNAAALAFDPSGTLYIGQGSTTGVRAVDLATNRIRTVINAVAGGLAVDSAGFLWITGTFNFTPVLMRFKEPSGATPGLQQSFGSISGSGIALRGSLAVVSNSLNDTVVSFSIPEPQITIRFQTSPPGRTISVDGTPRQTPFSASFAPGSNHTVSAAEQIVGSTRFLFDSWSDGGRPTHPFTATPALTSLSASFRQQFTFNLTAADPQGGRLLVSPPISGAFADPGNYTLTAESNEGFSFLGFSGDVPAGVTGRTFTLQLNAPKSITATFQPVNGFRPIRVNAGGPPFTDSLNQIWSPDNSFIGGLPFANSAAIASTTDPELYRTGRSGPVRFSVPVPAGQYNVRLKFAETLGAIRSQRRFHIAINNEIVLQNFDIVTEAGGPNRAIDKLFSVTATNAITVVCIPIVGNPLLNAIQIVSNAVGVTVSPVSSQITPGQSLAFSSTVAGSPDTSVKWSLEPNLGSISAAGVYQAPAAILERTAVRVTATSNADPDKTATATLFLMPEWQSTDLGNPATPGAYEFQSSLHALTAPTGDALRFTFQQLDGDGAISAHLAASTGRGALLIRDALSTSGTQHMLPITPEAPWVRFVKTGSTLTPYSSLDGVLWTPAAEPIATSLPNRVLIGLAALSGEVAFDDVAITGPTAVSIDQRFASIAPGDSLPLTAQVTGASDPSVTWSLSPALGSISPDGIYTAPTELPQPTTITVRATSTADPSASATATLSLGAFLPIRLNAGATASGDFTADHSFSGGQAESSARVSTEPFEYRFPAPAGRYLLRLHFTASPQPGRFDVLVNGQPVLTDFDTASALPTGATTTTIDLPIESTTNLITLRCAPSEGQARVSAIEILDGI